MRPGVYLNPVYGNSFINLNYYITAHQGETVFSPVSGKVTSISPFQILFPDGKSSISFDSMTDFEKSIQKKEFPYLDKSNLTSTIGIQIQDGSLVFISGMSRITTKIGDSVRQGQILGDVGFIRTFSTLACIRIEMSPSANLGALLLGEDNRAFFESLKVKSSSFKKDNLISVKDATSAFDVFAKCIVEDHPGLLDAHIRTITNASIAQARDQIIVAMKEEDFKILLNRIVAKLACSHTTVYPYGEDYIPNRFPLVLSVFQDKCIVVFDRRKFGTIQPGTEIISIDGVPALSYADIEKSLIQIDSEDDSVKEEYLSKVRYERWFNFREQIQVEMKVRDGKVVKEYMQPLSVEMAASMNSYPDWLIKPKNRFDILGDNMAILRINDIDEAEDNEPFIDILSKLISANIQNLIVDLRDNTGGKESNCASLFSLFTDKPFSLSLYSQIRHYGSYFSIDHSLNYPPAGTGETPPLFSDYRMDAEGFYKLPDKINYSPSAGGNFKGKLVVLINSGTSSSAVVLAGRLRDIGATIIGSETSGGYPECNGRSFVEILLPNTGLVLKMPLISVVFADQTSRQKKHTGLVPNIIVPPKMSDIIGVTDSQLQRSIEYFKKMR